MNTLHFQKLKVTSKQLLIFWYKAIYNIKRKIVISLMLKMSPEGWSWLNKKYLHLQKKRPNWVKFNDIRCPSRLVVCRIFPIYTCLSEFWARLSYSCMWHTHILCIKCYMWNEPVNLVLLWWKQSGPEFIHMFLEVGDVIPIIVIGDVILSLTRNCGWWH